MTVTTGLCQNSIAWHQQSSWLPRTPYAKNTFNYLMCLETSVPRAHGAWNGLRDEVLLTFLCAQRRMTCHGSLFLCQVSPLCWNFRLVFGFPKQLRPGPQSAVSSLTAGCLRPNTWVCSCQSVSLLQPPSWETAEVKKNIKLLIL